RGVELDLVDAVAEAVVGAQPGWIGVGLESPIDRLLGAGQRSEVVDQVVRPRRTLAFERLAQRRVRLEEVVVDKRRRLVHAMHRLIAEGPRFAAAPIRSLAECPAAVRDPSLEPD